MSRIRHAVMLIIRIAVLVGCFAAAALQVTVFQGGFGKTTITTEEERANLSVHGSQADKVKVDYDGNWIVLEVPEGGVKYGDFVIDYTIDSLQYDTTYYEKMFSDTKEEKAYFDALKEGPWYVTVYTSLLKEGATNAQKLEETYTLVNQEGKKETKNVGIEASNQSDKSKETKMNKGDKLSLSVLLGSETNDQLEEGTYRLKIGIQQNLVSQEASNEIPLLLRLKAAGKMCIEEIKGIGFKNIFSISSLLTFWGAMCLVGGLCFLWTDLGAAVRVALAVAEGTPFTNVLVKVYVNGVYTGEHVEYDAVGSKFFAFILTTGVTYLVLALTFPIRLVLSVLKDIISLFREDSAYESVSLLANLLGSFGIYAFLFGIMGTIGGMGGLYIAFIVAGIVAMIIAHKWTNRVLE